MHLLEILISWLHFYLVISFTIYIVIDIIILIEKEIIIGFSK